ncbi:DUF5803 family protein [Halorussus salilacus]|uniref:DUF5803 family protein n=1 Tax=Halorussus salilacus TaxID=2953750 RepID=UPI0020A14079|nr:DUF5803 family protein [Halorussus salilacus]USZ68228.1 DUF5803 family protein [Halorussus salilacus]
MNRRLLLGFAALALLALGAGCTGLFGPDEFSDDQLSQEADYDWNTTADVTVNITSDEYRAVYNVSNRSAVETYQRESLGGESPVEVSAVQFRYPNGTVATAEEFEVVKQDDRTVIRPPAEDGKLAYTAPHRGKSFSMPVTVEGSYEVVLPEGMRVGNFLLSQVRPGEHTTEGPDGTADGRVHIHWEEVTADTVVVRYYLARDLTIFAGIIGGAALVALVGLAYFRLQIRNLEREREELGLNVDTSDDEFDDGPPPGMR